MEPILKFHVPSEGLELVSLLKDSLSTSLVYYTKEGSRMEETLDVDCFKIGGKLLNQ